MGRKKQQCPTLRAGYDESTLQHPEPPVSRGMGRKTMEVAGRVCLPAKFVDNRTETLNPDPSSLYRYRPQAAAKERPEAWLWPGQILRNIELSGDGHFQRLCNAQAAPCNCPLWACRWTEVTGERRTVAIRDVDVLGPFGGRDNAWAAGFCDAP